MATLQEVLDALEHSSTWKRFQELRDQVARLEQRVAQLESQRGVAAAGDPCPMCKSRTFVVTGSAPDPLLGFAGVMRDRMKCSHCGHTEDRQRQTHRQPAPK